MTQAFSVQSIYTRSSRYESDLNPYNKQKHSISAAYRKRKQSAYMRKMRRLLFILVTAFILVTGVLIGSSVVKASNLITGPKYEKTKCYTSVRVDANTTLWDIAGEYMSEGYSSKTAYIDEIKRINHLNSDTIYTGQHLSIPYYEYTEIQNGGILNNRNLP